MSISGNTNTDLYSQCAAGDTEGNETTPLLTNVSTQTAPRVSQLRNGATSSFYLHRYQLTRLIDLLKCWL